MENDMKIEVSPTKSLHPKTSRESLNQFRVEADMITKARRSSAEILHGKDSTSPELTNLLNEKLEKLEKKAAHPTPEKSTMSETVRRAFTGHMTSKMQRSAEVTTKMIETAQSVCKLLETSHKEVEIKRLKEITALVSLANALCGKGYRNPEETDPRSTAGIEAELEMYQKAAHRLEQHEKSLRTGQPLSKMDQTLAQGLEQKKIERLTKPAKPLMEAFEKLFPEAAQLIRKSLPAMQLVQKAAEAGVKFCGYAEEGPVKQSHAYCAKDEVYVPKTSTDPVVAAHDFLFELTNGINRDRFAQVRQKVSEGTITSKGEYASEILKIEAETVIKTAEIWFKDMKNKCKNPFKYDEGFYPLIYEKYVNDSLGIEDVALLMKHSGGVGKIKTHGEYYMAQFEKWKKPED